MSEPIQVPVPCRVVGDRAFPRLVMVGSLWGEMDLQCCVHGEKLRWICDECEKFFVFNPEHRPPP